MSSPQLRVFLNSQEDKTLFELRKVVNVPQITKDRAQVIRLSPQGWKVSKISFILGLVSTDSALDNPAMEK